MSSERRTGAEVVAHKACVLEELAVTVDADGRLGSVAVGAVLGKRGSHAGVGWSLRAALRGDGQPGVSMQTVQDR